LTEEIYKARQDNQKLDYVINAGSVGAIENADFKVGDVVQCDVAMQTDLDLNGIGQNTIGTNQNVLNKAWDNENFHELPCPFSINLQKAICGSSDRFPIACGAAWQEATHKDGKKVTVLDQELGALAIVAQKHNIPLISIKYVTNIITKKQLKGENLEKSGAEWEKDLKENNACRTKLLENSKLIIDKIVEFENQKIKK
jgi:nucleoside phosphorylase